MHGGNDLQADEHQPRRTAEVVVRSPGGLHRQGRSAVWSSHRATPTHQKTNPGRVTLKALANFSPGLARSDNPGITKSKDVKTLKGFVTWRTLSGFILFFNIANPELSLRSNSGLTLANAFGVTPLLRRRGCVPQRVTVPRSSARADPEPDRSAKTACGTNHARR